MSCRRRFLPSGSGYVKPADTELAKANAAALDALIAARAKQDAALQAMWVNLNEAEKTNTNVIGR